MPAPTSPVQLRCNYFDNPLGVHDAHPRFSWKLATGDRRGARQTAYRITVSTTRSGKADLWDSGRVRSDAMTQVTYRGKSLASRQRAWWHVEIWDEKNRRSESVPAFWEAGLLDRKEWRGGWIGGALAGGPEVGAHSPYLRTIFNVGKKIAAARLYATALGLYEFHLNGQRVGSDVFTPGWTEYKKRVQYQAYDVTSLLRPGANAAGAILGDGWYCGHLGWRERNYYGERPQLLAQLVLTFTDGSTQTIVTDGAWKTSYGAIIEADLIHGESYDARRELRGWDEPGYDDSTWLPVVKLPDPGIEISATLGPCVRATQELKPIAPPNKVASWPTHKWVFDMGQNMVGRVRLHVRGLAGQVIRLHFAEMLNKDGTIYTENLRDARQTDHYVLRGDPAGETWESKFTFHGFRYVELRGTPVPESLLPDAITGIVLHSDTPRTGTFSCSDPLINQLQSNVDWGQRGNFLEVPTDCPQRNERLGWMGDAQVFCRTAAWNRNVAGFFTKWQRDISDAQGAEGQMPSVAPHIEGVGADGGPAWADAAAICPWTMYLCYADKDLLARHFDSLAKFIGYMEVQSKDLIRSHPDTNVWHGYGDWLALDGSGNVFGNTPKDLIGTALFAYSTSLVAKMARVLGRTKDAAHYTRLAERIRQAYQNRFLTADGIAAGLTQTSYVLTLQFDLAPVALRPKLLRELVRDIEARGHKLTTGFVGASYLPHVLSRFGRADIAYKLLHQKAWPSWLYAVTQGATTIWERWDGWTKENGFQDKGMNSFNHYAYGAIGSWLYAVVAGVDLDPATPGYKRLVLAPQPGGELTSARGVLQSPHGQIMSAWKTSAGRFEWEVTVPANTTASARFPVPGKAKITEGKTSLARTPGVTAVKTTASVVTCTLGAGHYKFTATWKPAPVK